MYVYLHIIYVYMYIIVSVYIIHILHNFSTDFPKSLRLSTNDCNSLSSKTPRIAKPQENCLTTGTSEDTCISFRFQKLIQHFAGSWIWSIVLSTMEAAAIVCYDALCNAACCAPVTHWHIPWKRLNALLGITKWIQQFQVEKTPHHVDQQGIDRSGVSKPQTERVRKFQTVSVEKLSHRMGGFCRTLLVDSKNFPFVMKESDSIFYDFIWLSLTAFVEWSKAWKRVDMPYITLTETDGIWNYLKSPEQRCQTSFTSKAVWWMSHALQNHPLHGHHSTNFSHFLSHPSSRPVVPVTFFDILWVPQTSSKGNSASKEIITSAPRSHENLCILGVFFPVNSRWKHEAHDARFMLLVGPFCGIWPWLWEIFHGCLRRGFPPKK